MYSDLQNWVSASRDRDTKFARFLVTELPTIFGSSGVSVRVVGDNYSRGCTYPVVLLTIPGVAAVILRNNNYAVLVSARLSFVPEEQWFRVVLNDAENSPRPAHYWFDGVPDDWQYDRFRFGAERFSELIEASFGPQTPLNSFLTWLGQRAR